jgi:hypothetical protein
MTTFETIEGSKIDSIFDHLIQQRTLVKVSLPERSFENLTLITDLREENDSKTFRIDPPKGLIENLRQASTEWLAFEFTGPDQLLHRFEAPAALFSEPDLWFAYPLKIARYQLRENFRVKVAGDSYVELEIDEEKVRMSIDNISLGGVYCLSKKKFKPLFDEDRRLKDMTVKVALNNDAFISTIDLVQVKRIEPHVRPKFFGIAFEFIKMKNDAKTRLVRYVYEMHRQYLQTRLKMEL